MQEDFTELQQLLRFKRHETPPPDYLEDFLVELHHRQRAELLRRPLWRLALDRLEGAFLAFQVPTVAYAGSCALALVAAGLISKNAFVAPVANSSAGLVSAGQHTLPSSVAPVNLFTASPTVHIANAESDSTDGRPSFFTARAPSSRRTSGSSEDRQLQTRYLLDSQPVRYEPRPASF